MVHGNDAPAGIGCLQPGIQPVCLRLHVGLVAVQHEHVEICRIMHHIRGFLHGSRQRRFGRQAELRAPQMAEQAAARGIDRVAYVIFVIAGHRDRRDHRVQETAGLEPVGPFDIAAATVHQIAGVQHETRIGRRHEGRADGARPQRQHAVLGIAHVDEADRAGGRRRACLEPLAPVAIDALHAVGIECIRLQPVEPHAMIGDRRQRVVDLDRQHAASIDDRVQIDTLAGCRHAAAGQIDAGIGCRQRDFGFGGRNRCNRAPGHRK